MQEVGQHVALALDRNSSSTFKDVASLGENVVNIRRNLQKIEQFRSVRKCIVQGTGIKIPGNFLSMSQNFSVYNVWGCNLFGSVRGRISSSSSSFRIQPVAKLTVSWKWTQLVLLLVASYCMQPIFATNCFRKNNATRCILKLETRESPACAYLYVIGFSCRVHAARHVDGVTPDIIVWFAGADYPGHHRTHVYTWKSTNKFRIYCYRPQT